VATVGVNYGATQAAVAFGVLSLAAANGFGLVNLRALGARASYQLPGFNGVGSGNLGAFSSLPVGNMIYDSIALSITKAGALVALTAPLDTDIKEIRITADGRILRRFTPALLLAYLQSSALTDGLTSDGATASCSVYLPFTDPTRPTVEGQESTALGTADVKQLKVELDFNVTGAVYTVAGIAQARIGAKSVRFFETWQIEQLALVNGVANFNALSTVDDYLGMIIGSGTATRVRVLVDQNLVYDQFKLDAMAQARSQNRGGTLTAPAAFPVAFDVTGQVTDVLPVAVRDPKTGAVIQRVGTINWEVTDTVAANVKALRRNLWLG
jgi:hypothetical protein